MSSAPNNTGPRVNLALQVQLTAVHAGSITQRLRFQWYVRMRRHSETPSTEFKTEAVHWTLVSELPPVTGGSAQVADDVPLKRSVSQPAPPKV